MEEQQVGKLNETAQQFTDAVIKSYMAVAERGVSAQEHNAQLTGYFFNQVVSNLRAQTEVNLQVTQQLADQQQRGAQAAFDLIQESVGVYTGLSRAAMFGRPPHDDEEKLEEEFEDDFEGEFLSGRPRGRPPHGNGDDDDE
jgi:hypothetical protein